MASILAGASALKQSRAIAVCLLHDAKQAIEQGRLLVPSSGGAVGLRAAIHDERKQGRLFRPCRLPRRDLLAAHLQNVAPAIGAAPDDDGVGAAHSAASCTAPGCKACRKSA